MRRMRSFAPFAFAVALASVCACNVYDPSLLDPTDGGGDACTTCGGKCVDLTTDPTHCGACGKTCKGTCAASTCQADVLLDGRNAPHMIAVDDTQVFFTEYSAVQITAVDKLTGQNLVVVAGQAVYPEALVLDATDVYWTNANDLVGGIGKAPKTGGGAQLGKSLPTPSAIAMDGSGFVYVTTGPTNKAPSCASNAYTFSVVRCPTSGCFVQTGCPTSGGPEVVLTDTSVPSAIAIAGTTLYLASRTGRYIKSCTLPACSDLTEFPNSTLSGPTDLVVTADALFVADTDGGNVLRCDRVTKACVPLAGKIDQPWRMAASGKDLYFTAYGRGVAGAAGLFHCALPDCKGAPQKLASGTGLYGVAVDATNVYFTEEGSTGGSSLDGRVLRIAR
ncbi:hypothetical protein BH09MYX1_BH09MYX1_25040 [soil metagenome]